MNINRSTLLVLGVKKPQEAEEWAYVCMRNTMKNRRIDKQEEEKKIRKIKDTRKKKNLTEWGKQREEAD